MADVLERFGVSIEKSLLARFDALVEAKGYQSRSEALRDMIRSGLNDADAEADAHRQAMGTLTIFYDHTRRDLGDRLTDLGHAHHDLILTTLHFHVDHDHCLEVLALRGRVADMRRFADTVIALKGIERGELVLTLPDAEAPSATHSPARSRRAVHPT